MIALISQKVVFDRADLPKKRGICTHDKSYRRVKNPKKWPNERVPRYFSEKAVMVPERTDKVPERTDKVLVRTVKGSACKLEIIA